MKRNTFILVVVAIAFFIAGSMATLGWQQATDDSANNQDSSENADDDTTVVSGTITRVRTDCAATRYLNDEGEVVEEDAAVCDAGSFVTIDDTKIQTATGLVPAEQAFGKHNPDWQPGEQLSLRAAETEFDYLTLDCETCGVVQ